MARKVYGQSKNEKCYFCNKLSFERNTQGFIVCQEHKNKPVEDIRCVCGSWLEAKTSKWGAFFVCSNCGPISLAKALHLRSSEGYNVNKKFKQKKEIVYEKNKIYTLKELEELWSQ
ncbi:hypothetical protein GOV04_02050 [Candidatus Woesearchaeota archaeon]|nr:hypothetical protein [Candidatus Woesearchaeota archaeon]